LLGIDANVLSLGRAEAQSGGPFSTSSLSGNYVYGSVGNFTYDDGGLSRTVGMFTAGGGNLTAGTFDAVVNGSVTANNPLQTPAAGSYIVSGEGEVQLTMNPSGGTPVHEILWLVNPSRAFLLVDDSTKVEDGTVDLQQNTSFVTTDLSQQATMLMEGITSTNYLTRVGTFIPDGKGNLTVNEVANAFTTSQGATISSPSLPGGSFSVDPAGRVTATINASPNIDVVLYLISPNQGYILQADTGVQVSGQIQLQTSQ